MIPAGEFTTWRYLGGGRVALFRAKSGRKAHRSTAVGSSGRENGLTSPLPNVTLASTKSGSGVRPLPRPPRSATDRLDKQPCYDGLSLEPYRLPDRHATQGLRSSLSKLGPRRLACALPRNKTASSFGSAVSSGGWICRVRRVSRLPALP